MVESSVKKRNYVKEKVIYLRVPDDEYVKITKAALISGKSINKFCWLHLVAIANKICKENE
jgi:uncharacterized protein (DUF1778 family)